MITRYWLISILMLFVADVAFSAEAWTPDTTIASISTHTIVNGDVIIATETAAAGCAAGFWLPAAAAGFNANLSAALSAYHAKAKVMVFGETTERWPASGGEYCKLTRIILK